MLRGQTRLIAGHQQDPRCARHFEPECFDSHPNGACDSLLPALVHNDLCAGKIHAAFDRITMGSEHRKHRLRARLAGNTNGTLKQRFAVEDEELLRPAQTAARSRGNDDRCDALHGTQSTPHLDGAGACVETSFNRQNIQQRLISVTDESSAIAEVSPSEKAQDAYGLHAGVLGPLETLAQSVSAMAPSTSPSLTIPLVFAIAGNATWLVYLLAMGATLLVGFCVSRFARLSASPGSLYSYTAETLPRVFGVAAGWGLLIAYLATGVSVAGGALYYTNLLAQQFLHRVPPSLAVAVAVCVVAGYVAYRDVKLSAELMLWIEICSLSLIFIVLAVMLVRNGLRLDMEQFQLRGVSFSALGPALVLSMFSFVGFESATTLGAEARDPLRTIPRAVVQCAIIAGIFFVLCSYSEVLGFRGESGKLSETTSPLHLIAGKAGVSPLGVGIDFGAFISMIACVLACVTAASRVLMRMARERLLPVVFEKTGQRGTPVTAIACSTGVILAATLLMTLRGVNGAEIYDLAGSLSVFGFLTAYALVAIALPFARRARGQHSLLVAGISVIAALVVVLIAVYDLRSTADAAHARLPYIYLVYIAVELAWFGVRRRAMAIVNS